MTAVENLRERKEKKKATESKKGNVRNPSKRSNTTTILPKRHPL